MNTKRTEVITAGLIGLLIVGIGAHWLRPSPKPVVTVTSEREVQTLQASPAHSTGQGLAPTPAPPVEPPSPRAVVARPVPQPNSATQPTYQYNDRGQVLAITYPDGTTYTYIYNAKGDKTGERGRDGKEWTYAYDQNDQPKSVVDPAGRVTHP